MESQSPISIKIGKKILYLMKDSEVNKMFSKVDYSRIPNKTDDFVLYRSICDRDTRPEIILQTRNKFTGWNTSHLTETLAKKIGSWHYEEILNTDALSQLKFPPPQIATRERVERILAYDKLTEGDSLRLFNYVTSIPLEMPEEFWSVMLLWLHDEMNHYAGFKAVYNQLFSMDLAREETLAKEESNFSQFDSVMQDSFKLLVALTYDEASTINGYKHDLPIYTEISQQLGNFVKRVNVDESWHFSEVLKDSFTEKKRGRI